MLHERLFHTGTATINYAEGPTSGPPIVILHGGSGSWRSGLALIEALTGRWHVYAPDLRGHGLSGHVPGRYHLPDYVDDMAAFLEHIVREPAILYGHSLGGEVAIMLAARHPTMVRAVIDGDAPLSTQDHPTEEPMHKAMNTLWHRLAGRPEAEIIPALKEMPLAMPGKQAVKRAVEVLGDDNPWFAFQAQNLHRLDPDMLAAVLDGPEVMLDGYDPEVLLPAIACPVLLLQADPATGGLLSDREVARGMRLLAHPAHVRLDNIGHELHGPPGQERRVLRAIAPFLEAVRSSPLSPLNPILAECDGTGAARGEV